MLIVIIVPSTQSVVAAWRDLIRAMQIVGVLHRQIPLRARLAGAMAGRGGAMFPVMVPAECHPMSVEAESPQLVPVPSAMVPVEETQQKIVEAECLQIIEAEFQQMSAEAESQLVPVARPSMIRIGHSRHAYNYTKQGGSMVYKCGRGSDWCNPDERLFLFQGGGGSGP